VVLPLRALLGVVALSLPFAAAGAIWVSADGNDANPGTEDAPLRTLEKALEVVRAATTRAEDDVTVFVSGIHRVTRPLVYTERDAGAAGFSVIYMAAPGEHPVLTAAVPVTGWKPEDPARHVWAAPLPPGLDACTALYVDGFTSPRSQARRPEAPRHPEDLVVVPREERLWSEASGADIVENAPELLLHPGDWWYESSAHVLHYMSLIGEDPRSERIEAAANPTLVRIQAKAAPNTGGFVFKGITLTATGTSPGSAAVEVDGPCPVQLLDLGFLHLPATALHVGKTAEGVSVEGCVFGDIGASAVAAEGSSVSVSNSRFTRTGLRSVLAPAIAAAGCRGLRLSSLSIERYPLSALALPFVNVEMDRTSLRVSEPLFGPDGLAIAGSGPQPGYAESAGPVAREGVPAPPDGVCAEAEDEFAYVTWNPPRDDGGKDVAAYTVTALGGDSMTVAAEAFRRQGYVLFPGLKNGRPTSFVVSAATAAGSSWPSVPSAPVVPGRTHRWRVPPVPAKVSAKAVTGGIELVITPAAPNGGSPIMAFAVTLEPGATRLLLEGRDVLRTDATHPLRRVIPLAGPVAFTQATVSAINAKGEGEATHGPVAR
jgi:hypothetical protein